MDFSSKPFCTEEELFLSDNKPIRLRVFLFLFGLSPLIALYELFLRPRWKEFNLGMLPILIICAVGILMGVGLLVAAMRAENRILRFDARKKTVIYICKSPFTAMKEKKYAFHQILRAEIKTYDYEGDGSFNDYGIEITFKDNKKITIGHLASKEEILLYQKKIHAWLHW